MRTRSAERLRQAFVRSTALYGSGFSADDSPRGLESRRASDSASDATDRALLLTQLLDLTCELRVVGRHAGHRRSLGRRERSKTQNAGHAVVFSVHRYAVMSRRAKVVAATVAAATR